MTHTACPRWEEVSAAVDGELPEPEQTQALDHALRCGYCGPLLAGLRTDQVFGTGRAALARPALDPDRLSGRERRWLRAVWTRWLLAAAAVVIVCAAVPTFATGHGLDSQAHAARHLATWQIGFGVGLLVAAVMSRLTHAMLALAATFAILTITATVIDLVNGHSGPVAESVHLIELVAVILLWQLTPPHLLPWRSHTNSSRTARSATPADPALRLVPPDGPDGPDDPTDPR